MHRHLLLPVVPFPSKGILWRALSAVTQNPIDKTLTKQKAQNTQKSPPSSSFPSPSVKSSPPSPSPSLSSPSPPSPSPPIQSSPNTKNSSSPKEFQKSSPNPENSFIHHSHANLSSEEKFLMAKGLLNDFSNSPQIVNNSREPPPIGFFRNFWSSLGSLFHVFSPLDGPSLPNEILNEIIEKNVIQKTMESIGVALSKPPTPPTKVLRWAIECLWHCYVLRGDWEGLLSVIHSAVREMSPEEFRQHFEGLHDEMPTLLTSRFLDISAVYFSRLPPNKSTADEFHRINSLGISAVFTVIKRPKQQNVALSVVHLIQTIRLYRGRQKNSKQIRDISQAMLRTLNPLPQYFSFGVTVSLLDSLCRVRFDGANRWKREMNGVRISTMNHLAKLMENKYKHYGGDIHSTENTFDGDSWKSMIRIIRALSQSGNPVTENLAVALTTHFIPRLSALISASPPIKGLWDKALLTQVAHFTQILSKNSFIFRQIIPMDSIKQILMNILQFLLSFDTPPPAFVSICLADALVSFRFSSSKVADLLISSSQGNIQSMAKSIQMGGQSEDNQNDENSKDISSSAEESQHFEGGLSGQLAYRLLKSLSSSARIFTLPPDFLDDLCVVVCRYLSLHHGRDDSSDTWPISMILIALLTDNQNFIKNIVEISAIRLKTLTLKDLPDHNKRDLNIRIYLIHLAFRIHSMNLGGKNEIPQLALSPSLLEESQREWEKSLRLTQTTEPYDMEIPMEGYPSCPSNVLSFRVVSYSRDPLTGIPVPLKVSFQWNSLSVTLWIDVVRDDEFMEPLDPQLDNPLGVLKHTQFLRRHVLSRSLSLQSQSLQSSHEVTILLSLKDSRWKACEIKWDHMESNNRRKKLLGEFVKQAINQIEFQSKQTERK